ncbi:hypothetical protein Tco_0405271 [Tanacetum coccineum]
MTKTDFSKFHGEHVKGWVYRCKQFFKNDGVPEKLKLELALMHVYDKALVWHQQFIKKYGDNVPWDIYEQEASKRFGAMFEDPMVDLKILKQCSRKLDCLEVILDEEVKAFEDALPNVVDEQSTHNFVDLHIAKRIGCRMKTMYPLKVSVANGEAMTSNLMCQGFSERLHVIDAMFLPLGACDMVLEINTMGCTTAGSSVNATQSTVQCYPELYDSLCLPCGLVGKDKLD